MCTYTKKQQESTLKGIGGRREDYQGVIGSFIDLLNNVKKPSNSLSLTT